MRETGSGEAAREKAEQTQGVPGEARRRGPPAQPARLAQRESAWRLQAIKGMRIRHFSYHTEKSYPNWCD